MKDRNCKEIKCSIVLFIYWTVHIYFLQPNGNKHQWTEYFWWSSISTNSIDSLSASVETTNTALRQVLKLWNIFEYAFWVIINRRGHLTLAEPKYYNLMIACPFWCFHVDQGIESAERIRLMTNDTLNTIPVAFQSLK